MSSHKTLLSIGHGYSARALAKMLLPQGWQIIGTSRDPAELEEIEATGVTPVLWPGGDLASAIRSAGHILISVAPHEKGDPVLNALKADIAARASGLSWVGYLSTTGVYGDHGGGLVDEYTALTPTTKRGKMRVAAEAEWQSILDLPLTIFRLAGIYGPGRGPFTKVRSGTARRIIKKNQLFSRIHCQDIAQVLAASIAKPRIGAIYNVCDDVAAPPEDVIAYAAELLGLPVPPAIPIEDAEMTPMARSFYAESKRVSNTLIKEELGVTLKYPDYKIGLEALLASES